MKDLIDERYIKEKMQKSILKWWNVHYMTPEELEEEQEKEHDPSVTGTTHQSDSVRVQGQERGTEPTEKECEEKEDAVAETEKDFNSTTGSYSGGYGKGGADPEHEDQIAAILMERDDALRDLIMHTEEESKEE